MNIALVQHAQNDVDRDQRRDNEPGRTFKRILERLRRALEGAGDRLGDVDHHCGGVNSVDGLPERHARRKVEGDRHCGELCLVVHRQIGHMAGVEFHQRRERHLLSGRRRFDIELVQRVRVGLQVRRYLKDDMVAVDLCKILRNLRLPKGIFERLVDIRRLDAKTGRLVAIDGHGEHRAAVLLVGVNVAQYR